MPLLFLHHIPDPRFPGIDAFAICVVVAISAIIAIVVLIIILFFNFFFSLSLILYTYLISEMEGLGSLTFTFLVYLDIQGALYPTIKFGISHVFSSYAQYPLSL